jgi:membrane-associated phospholipid phosphatase
MQARCSVRWAIALLLTGAAVCICYFWLDKPIAFFAHAELGQSRWFYRATQIPEFLAPIALLALLVLGVRAVAALPVTRSETVVLLCSVSLLIANASKNQLKFLFGRTWPETWIQGNPSLIRDGVYGFHPFHSGAAFRSFPSGHTAVVCAVLAVLWLCYPRLRFVYACAAAAVIIGLVGANFHFLSDCIAGAFVGAWIGWVVVMLWDRHGSQPARDIARNPPA